MTCSNDFTVIDNLLELMELFTVKESKVSTCDLAEELQHFLFTWTQEHDNSYSEWRESVLTGKRYQTSASAESSDVFIVSESGKRTAVGVVKKSDELTELDKLAVKISEVMKNPLTPTNLYNAMSDELSHVTGFADSPEWILGNLKKQSAEE